MTTNSALIVATPTALDEFNSGASLRLNKVENILLKAGYSVQKLDYKSYLKLRTKANYDLIAVISFASARSLVKARSEAKILWFDATDSWKLSRISRFFRGEPLQLLAYLLDRVFLSTCPKLEILSFISLKDLNHEFRFAQKHAEKTYIFPNSVPFDRKISPSNTRLVYIADGSYGPNAKALKIISQIAKLLPKEIPVVIVGKGYKKLYSNLQYSGYISTDELYGERDIHLAPINSGAGIKNKVAEPLQLGLHVITSYNGANGIKLNLPNLHIAKSIEDYVNLVKDLANAKRSPLKCNIFERDDSDAIERFIGKS